MKFGQLIAYNMRKIFVQKSYIEFGRETSPGLFTEKLSLSISLGQWNLIQFVLIACQDEGYRNILKLSCRLLAFTSY